LARSAGAGVSPGAIHHDPARGSARARGGVAFVRGAGDRRVQLARARAITGLHSRVRLPHAHGRAAVGARRVPGATAVAVAPPVGAAGRRRLGRADVAGVVATGRDFQAGPGGARLVAREADRVAEAGAADAIHADRARALRTCRAGGAHGQQVGARSGLAVEAVRAVSIARTGRPARSRRAGVGHAAGRRLDAGSGAVAMPDRREGRAGARGCATAGGGRGTSARAGAVAGAVEAAGRVGGAAVVRLHLAVRDGVTEARQAGDVARLTRTAARRRAAHAVDAVIAVALRSGGADLPEAFLAARPGVADVTRRAVGVAATGGVAGRAVARVRTARQHHRRAAPAAAIAGANQRRRRRAERTGGRSALNSGRVALAAARAVAEAGRPAAGCALVHALGPRVGATGGHRRAGPFGSCQRARYAAGRAGGGAADALRADAAGALDAVAVAAGAVRFEAARSGRAHGGRGAVRVGGADGVADGDAAAIGEAGGGGRRHAGPRAVARRLARQRGGAGLAGGVRARCPDPVLLTRAALALPVGAAAGGAAVGAGLRRIGRPGGHVGAGTHRS